MKSIIRRPILCTISFALLSITSAPSAHAQIQSPYFVAPWNAQSESQEENQDSYARAPQNITYNKKPPRTPVITPVHTKQLMAHLEGKAPQAQPSPLETSYSNRIVEQLEQFGYEMFASSEEESSTPPEKFSLPAGAVQDDFILGIGDELEITFRGRQKSSGIYKVNNQGLLIVEDLKPIPVVGRNIGQIRETLENYASAMPNTDVFISLSSVKQINVLIAGHVNKPGRQHLTTFHSALDALMEAGGIQKTGSLRQIKLIRNGRSTIIDLYGLLVHGSDTMDLQLRDGDRIIVPPIGATVAIAGNVKRPAIYETMPALKGMHHKPQHAAQKLSMNDLLGLAGGILSPGQNRFMRLGLTADGREVISEVTEPYTRVFGSGSILMVSPSIEHRTGMIELTGATNREGWHDLGDNPNLSSILNHRNVFSSDVYPLLGMIERHDDTQLSRTLVPFPPLLVLNGGFDRTLKDGDVVHLFSRDQILNLEQPYQTQDAQLETVAMGSAVEGAHDDILDDDTVRSFLMERAAYIRGAVRKEGSFPVADGITLENLLAVAGGMTLEAHKGNVEITSKLLGEGHQKDGRSGTLRKNINLNETPADEIMIGAGDTVRVNQKFKKIKDNSVLIIGEVHHPGRYDLLPGDTMQDLLERAGGLTAQAYPDGAIFSRDSERRAEEARYKAEARELELTLANAVEQKDQPDLAAIKAVQDVIRQLKNAEAVGRITVEADPAALDTQPELNLLLEAKDRLYIPKRPLTVRVMGEALSPAALQFRSEKAPRDYIAEAGGFTYHADKDRTFVLYPDGSAQPLQVNAWNHKNTFIPPGSAIIIPRDPKPFDFLQTTRDITQILANLAFSAVVIDDIQDDN
jgi:polysaccharide export outer membrane protein